MATTTNQDRQIEMRCRAFTATPIQLHRIRVSADGTVRVYDSIAGHYTTCHSLSQGAQRRARKLAQ